MNYCTKTQKQKFDHYVLKMNIFQVVIIFLMVYVSGLVLGDDHDTKTISYKELNNIKIIGQLGIELGSIVNVEGTVLLPAELDKKADEGKYILRICSVNGEILSEKIAIELLYAYSGVDRSNKGEKVKYIGFESGSFDGMPDGYLKYLHVASQRFNFCTYFIALKKITNAINSPRDDLLIKSGIIEYTYKLDDNKRNVDMPILEQLTKYKITLIARNVKLTTLINEFNITLQENGAKFKITQDIKTDNNLIIKDFEAENESLTTILLHICKLYRLKSKIADNALVLTSDKE
ncbi:MAG: hypothetical protein WCI51_07815 [Lentisphaerota bacterium]